MDAIVPLKMRCEASPELSLQKLASQLEFLLDNPRYRVCYTDEIWIRHGKRRTRRHFLRTLECCHRS